MTALVGVLVEHRHTRESWGVARFELSEPCPDLHLDKGAVVTVVGGRIGLTQAGEALRLTGELESHPRFGERFQVTEQASLGIQSAAQAHRWLERLDGVGPRLAERLGARFGERIMEVLETQPGPGVPDPLLDVEGVGPLTAQTIRESWQGLAASGSPEDLRYLDGLGLTHWETNNTIAFAKLQGRGPRELLEQAPYSLTEVKGFGWKRTDVVALKAGASYQAPARLETAAVYALGELCDGDTLVPLGRLVAEVAKLTGCEESLCLDAVVACSQRDQLVITQDDARMRWVHPPELVQAERAIWRVLRDQDRAAEEEARHRTPGGWTPRVLEGGAGEEAERGAAAAEPPAEPAKHEELRPAANGGGVWTSSTWKPSGVVEPWEGP